MITRRITSTVIFILKELHDQWVKQCAVLCFGSYLVNVNRGDRCSGDWWVAGRVGERFAWTNRELLLFPHGHNLLGNWRREWQRHSNRLFMNPVKTFSVKGIQRIWGGFNFQKVSPFESTVAWLVFMTNKCSESTKNHYTVDKQLVIQLMYKSHLAVIVNINEHISKFLKSMNLHVIVDSNS